MSSDQDSKTAQPSNGTSSQKSSATPEMSDFLQAPKKKRKSFVVLAVGPNIDKDNVVAIQKFFADQFPKLILLTTSSLDELAKLASKNIILSLIDDELSERRETLRITKYLKENKKDGPLPTLFFTKDPPALITDYQTHLKLWHEVDDYANVLDENRHALFAKIKSILEVRNQRRSRRFKTSIPITFQILDYGDHRFKGELLDFSLHGALLSTSDPGHRFNTKDQIVIHFPLGNYVQGKADFFRVSARVRRVLIAGDKAGISWEYLTDEKVATLTEVLTAIVDSSLARAAAATRHRYSKLLEEDDPAHSNKTKASRKYEF